MMRRTFRRITHFSKNEHPSSTSLSGLPASPEGRRVSRFMALHSLRIALARAGGGVLLRLRARPAFLLRPVSDRFLLDRMNGTGIGRPGAPSTDESTLFARASFLVRY
jgi:hypothetical protein